MSKNLPVVYGSVCYLAFLAAFLYAIGFVGGFVVPKDIDGGPPTTFWLALATDVALLALFALQHTVMARPAFKTWLAKAVPQAVERSTFVLAASAALALLFWQWRPIADPVWSVAQPAARVLLWSLFALGWGTALLATVMAGHFALFGIDQVLRHARGRDPAPPRLVTGGLYGLVRFPIQFGFLVAFWATPDMSAGHLLFALGTTGFILFGVRTAERDLLAAFGESYAAYRRRVPRLLPYLRRASDGAADRAAG